MRTILALCALLIGLPAHANMISADGIFDVTYRGDSESGIVDPPHEGFGFFHIDANRIADFEFSMLGFTWTEDDTTDRCCGCCNLQFGVPVITIEFADEFGGGLLVWDFTHGGNFGILFDAGDFQFRGTSENGQAGSVFQSFAFQVPEPGTLPLLALGLIALGLEARAVRRSRPSTRR
jgi:PEP-CTERM motif